MQHVQILLQKVELLSTFCNNPNVARQVWFVGNFHGRHSKGKGKRIEKKSEKVKKGNLCNYGIGWHIQKEQDEDVHLLKISLLQQIGDYKIGLDH